jgi:hypothetical protein
MSLLDMIGGVLSKAAPNLLQSIGTNAQQLSQYALFGNQGVTQWNENQRQKDQLAQQALFHNTLSEYQKQSLAQAQAAAGQSQDNWTQEQQMRMLDGIGLGRYEVAAKGDPNSFTMPGVYENDPGITVKAKAPLPPAVWKPSQEEVNTNPELDPYSKDGLQIPQKDLFDHLQAQILKREQYSAKNEDHANFMKELNLRKQETLKTVNDLFNPQRYKDIYGEVPKDLESQKESLLTELDNAYTIDSHKSNTASIMGLKSRLLDNTAWEKRWYKRNDQEFAQKLELSKSKMEYDAKYPDPTPQEVKTALESYKQDGLNVLPRLHSINPKLANEVNKTASAQGIGPAYITGEEIKNRDNAKIAIEELDKAMGILSTPGIDRRIGPVLSRWKSFQSKDIGAAKDMLVKELADHVHYGMAVMGKVHYSARGQANEMIQNKLNGLINPDTMDGATLRRSLIDLRGLMSEYVNEGRGNSVAEGLGLPPASGSTFGFKGK